MQQSFIMANVWAVMGNIWSQWSSVTKWSILVLLSSFLSWCQVDQLPWSPYLISSWHSALCSFPSWPFAKSAQPAYSAPQPTRNVSSAISCILQDPSWNFPPHSFPVAEAFAISSLLHLIANEAVLVAVNHHFPRMSDDHLWVILGFCCSHHPNPPLPKFLHAPHYSTWCSHFLSVCLMSPRFCSLSPIMEVIPVMNPLQSGLLSGDALSCFRRLQSEVCCYVNTWLMKCVSHLKPIMIATPVFDPRHNALSCSSSLLCLSEKAPSRSATGYWPLMGSKSRNAPWLKRCPSCDVLIMMLASSLNTMSQCLVRSHSVA